MSRVYKVIHRSTKGAVTVKRMLGVLSCVTMLAACVTTKAAVLDSSLGLQPICPDGVRIFTDSTKVGQPYTEVALMNSSGDDDMTSENGMINSQKKKAAKLGANGVILGDMKGAGTGAKVWHSLLGTSANRKGKAMAIYIAGDSLRVQKACRTTS